MLMRVGAGQSSRLSIPRDTIVDIPGHGRDKINAAYAIGGPALTITTVKQYLGIRSTISSKSLPEFPDFIDALGGIRLHGSVPGRTSAAESRTGARPWSSRRARITSTAARPSRSRDAQERVPCGRGRPDRAKRQQQILSAIKSRVRVAGTFFRLPWSVQAPKADLRTT